MDRLPDWCRQRSLGLARWKWIGLRSTRVRLLNAHVVTMPNDELADNDVENIGSRPHIRRVANIHIPLDTPLEKIKQCVAMIQDTLADHEGMDPEFPPRVYFDEFNPDSFNLRIWYLSSNWWMKSSGIHGKKDRRIGRTRTRKGLSGRRGRKDWNTTPIRLIIWHCSERDRLETPSRRIRHHEYKL
jgi:hypothetical protein